MPLDPTQVDASYQVRNIPAGGMTSVTQINPGAGPYTGSTLTVDHATGLKAAAGPGLSLELASLTQMGGIGASGLQQLQGPNFLVGTLLAPGIPSWGTSLWSGVVQDGLLGFFNSGYDSFSTAPGAWIDWAITIPRVLTIFSNEAIHLVNNGFGGATIISNASAGSAITLNGISSGLTVFDPHSVAIQSGNTNVYSAIISNSYGFGTNGGLNLVKTAGGLPVAYGINSLAGQTGTLLDGSIITGGIVTSLGATHPGGPPTGTAGGDLSGTYPNPTVAKINTHPVASTAPTLNYVLTWNGSTWVPAASAGGPPSGAAGGDLSGTYPNPTVAQLQTRPMSASAPAGGDVLTWSGSAWTPAAPAPVAPTGAAGGDLGSTYPNPTVVALQTFGVATTAPTSGNVLTYNTGLWRPITPAAPTAIIDGSDNLTLDGAGGITSSVGGRNVISQTAAGTTTVGGSFGSMVLSSTGAVTLLGTASSEYTSDASGNVTVQAGTSKDLTLSNPTSAMTFVMAHGGSATLTGSASCRLSVNTSRQIDMVAGGAEIFMDGSGPSINLFNNFGTGLVVGSTFVKLISSGTANFSIFGATAVAQQTAAAVTAGYTANVTANLVYDASTFTGNVGSTAYTIGDLVAAFKRYGYLVM